MPRNLTFSINFQGGKASVQELHLLEVELKKITSEYRGLVNDMNKPSNRNNPQMAQWAKDAEKARLTMHHLGTNIKEVKKELVDQYKEFQNNGRAIGSVSALEREYAKLKTEYMELSREARKSPLGDAMAAEARKVKDEVDKAHAAVNNYKNNVGNYPRGFGGGLLQGAANQVGLGGLMGGGAMGVGTAVGAGAALAALATAKQAYQVNKEIDTLQGAVQKTTGLTADEVERLTKNLKDLDSVTSTADLLRIAEEAGRFGVEGAEGVEAFTKAVNLLSIGLGDEFKGDVADITTTVAQLSNVMFGATSNGEVMSTRFLALGNVLNGLANSGAASAEGIADVAQRMSSTLIPLGFAQEEILGISSALLESGVNVERGATAFTRVNGILRKNFTDVAKRLGLNVEEFRKMLDTKPVEAFNLVVEKTMQMADKSGTNLTVLLKELGINSEYAKEVFNAWGNNQGLFNTRIGESAVLIKDINTLMRDQATLTNTVDGQLQRMKNAFYDLFINSGIQNGIKNTFSGIADGINGVAKALETMKTKTGFGIGDVAEAILNPLSLFQRGGAAILDRKRRQQQDRLNKDLQSGTNSAMGGVYDNLANNRAAEIYGMYTKGGSEFFDRFPFETKFESKDLPLNPDGKGSKGEIPAVIGSLRYYQELLAKLNKKIDNTNANDSQLGVMLLQAKELEKTIAHIESRMESLKNGVKNTPLTAEMLNKETFGGRTTVGEQYRSGLAAANKKYPTYEEALRRRNLDRSLAGEVPLNSEEEARFKQSFIYGDPEELWMAQSEARRKSRSEEIARDLKSRKPAKRDKSFNAPLLSAENLFPDASPDEKARIDEIGNEAINQAKNVSDAIFEYKEMMREENLKREIKALDREYAAKIKAAEGNATLQEALELERVEKEEKIRREAFEKEKKARIAQALIGAALAIVQAFGQLGPIAGAIAAVGVTVATGLQIAAIRNSTFADGGHTGDGFHRDHTGEKVAGVVHAKEYVVKKDHVQKYRPLIDMMERDRLSSMRGFVDGGHTSPQSYNVDPQYMTYAYAKNASSGLDMEMLQAVIATAVENGSFKGSLYGTEVGTEKGQSNVFRMRERISKQEKEF